MSAKGFRFRLQPLLRRWELEEERIELKIAQVDQELRRLADLQARTSQGIASSRLACADLLQARPTPADVLAQYARTEGLRGQLSNLEAERQRVLESRAALEAERVLAARERRRMEIARERDLKRFLDEQARLEGVMLDELAVLRYAGRAARAQAEPPTT